MSDFLTLNENSHILRPKLINEAASYWHSSSIEEVRSSREKNHGNLVFKACIQRAGVKNQMGRLYPKEILEREFNAYQKFVDTYSAYGECFTRTASILTKDGWKLLKDIADDESVYTMNTKTGALEVQQITEKVVRPFKGKMIHINGNNIDTLVTPEHRFWIVDRDGNGSFVRAKTLLNVTSKLSHSHIPKTTTSWSGYFPEMFSIPDSDIEIESSVWFGFLGLWLAEGHIQSNTIVVTQNKGEKADKIRELLSTFPNELKWRELSKSGSISGLTFKLTFAPLAKYLSELGKVDTKYIPYNIKQAPSSLLEQLLEWFILGDGRDYSKYNNARINTKRRNVFSVSKRLVEDLQEIVIKLGGCGNITKEICKKDYLFAGRLIKAENKRPIYVLNIETTHGVYLDSRMISVTETECDDTVYCVRVPNETFFCKDNGSAYINGEDFDPDVSKMFLSANCDHPDTAVVAFQQASHIITKQWSNINNQGQWEWWADITLLNTRIGKDMQAIAEQGYRISISSRAVGTTERENKYDADVVQDNLVVIAFDLVTQPSTHFANLQLKESFLPDAKDLYMNENAYRRYMENSAEMMLKKEDVNITKESLASRIDLLLNYDIRRRNAEELQVK